LTTTTPFLKALRRSWRAFHRLAAGRGGDIVAAGRNDLKKSAKEGRVFVERAVGQARVARDQLILEGPSPQWRGRWELPKRCSNRLGPENRMLLHHRHRAAVPERRARMSCCSRPCPRRQPFRKPARTWTPRAPATNTMFANLLGLRCMMFPLFRQCRGAIWNFRPRLLVARHTHVHRLLPPSHVSQVAVKRNLALRFRGLTLADFTRKDSSPIKPGRARSSGLGKLRVRRCGWAPWVPEVVPSKFAGSSSLHLAPLDWRGRKRTAGGSANVFPPASSDPATVVGGYFFRLTSAAKVGPSAGLLRVPESSRVAEIGREGIRPRHSRC